MSILEDFFVWLKNHDKHILESHMKKDRNSLNESLALLQAERQKMKNMLHVLETITEYQELISNKPEGTKVNDAVYFGREDEYKSLEKKFQKIW